MHHAKKVIHHRKVLGKYYYFLQLTGDRAWLPLSLSLRELRATQGGCEVNRRLVLWEWSGASPRPPSWGRGPHLLPPYIYNSGKGLRILDSIAKGISLFPRFFCMVHPIPTSPFIQYNDFCTCVYCLLVFGLLIIFALEKVCYVIDFSIFLISTLASISFYIEHNIIHAT